MESADHYLALVQDILKDASERGQKDVLRD
jgi:hypothetical protein